jgi:hypothetical protein
MKWAIKGARHAPLWRAIPLAACVSLLGACATYSETIRSTERSLAEQKPLLALQEFEKLEMPARDRVLFLMNRGMLLRMAGDYDGSTRTLEEAKQLIEALSAVSVREQAASLLVNDAAQSFVGDEFEQVMVNAYLALNYLEQHRLEQARVEALQVDVRLQEIAQQVPESRYTEDPFVRYLTGIIYEERREWSDAMIAYRKAYEAYRKHADRFAVAVPDPLKHDLIRLADRMGLADEAARYREEFGIAGPSRADLETEGELVFTLHSGLAPMKNEQSITMQNPSTGRLLRLALPAYHPRPRPLVHARVTVGERSVRTYRVADIDSVAVKSLEARMPAITARAFVRMAAKDKVARDAGERGGAQGLVGVAVNIANTLTERADTRSWFTLPSQIQLARIALPPGRHLGRIELVDDHDRVLQSSEIEFAVSKGEKTYLSRHWIPSYLGVRP